MRFRRKIYGLRVIGQEQFFYIGSTSSLQQRIIGHLSAAKSDQDYNKEKSQIIRDNDYKIEIVELKNICTKSWEETVLFEVETIDQYRKAGHPLTNKPKKQTRYPNLKITAITF